MSLSITFIHPILSRHVHSTALSLSYPRPRFFFLSPPTTNQLRFHILYPVPRRATEFPVAATASLFQDTTASASVLAGAYVLVSTFDTLTQKQLIQQSLSRKLVHILSGLLFALSWPIFRELLRGPLYYVLILILCALVFWRESPTGVISLAMMCGGDGVADIMGRKFGSSKLPYNQSKSWAGSISMFVFGFFISMGMLYYFSVLGYFRLDWGWTIHRVALISLMATVVESLPITKLVDDNISVPLATMVAAYLSFRS
ncbi:phytol kinase 1, chloroplastic isoform X2 [Durio zibethinus]|uniref:phytol kinase n=1 Tax=Durio zibethinus TaxID=66656 RepID=A0A6P5YRY3_DURZI|nr:phytol kinase 1, chloroplastic isoform X2 [Durio zibethinus]